MGEKSMSAYTPQWPHGEIKEIFSDIFFVTGTNIIHYNGTDIQASRNMIIVRSGQELTLINTVRLDDNGLKVLDALGKVTHIVKIGPFHGRDDAFYLDRYENSKLWALRGMQHGHGKTTDVELIPNGSMPFPGSTIFIFETTSQPEGIIHIAREGGILISCDSIKNWTHVDHYFSEETGKNFVKNGLIRPANIDSVWSHEMHPQVSDFDRLLTLFAFRHLLSAHGDPMLDTAHEQVATTVKYTFGLQSGK